MADESILVVSGIRDILPESIPAAEAAIRDEAVRATEVRLGGALGVDTVALIALRKQSVRKVVYVPFRVLDQPKAAQRAIASYADAVVEMELARARSAYLARTRAMLTGAHRLLAVTDGRDSGGTAYAIKFARTRGIDTRTVHCHARSKNRPKQTDMFEV